MSLLSEIVCEIADREEVDPLDLETPLYEVVDAETLDAVTGDVGGQRDALPAPIEFEYYGYTVEIDGSGTFSVSDAADTTTDRRAAESSPSLGSVATANGHPERSMKNVADIVAARNRPFAERLDGLLETVRDGLGTESATLSYVQRDTYVFEAVDAPAAVGHRSGSVVPLADTVCRRVVETEQAFACSDVAAEFPGLAESAPGVASYIGVPVFVDGNVYGTFCFYDSEPRDEAFSEWDLAFVELLGNWVSSELERRRRERALHAATTERPYGVN